MQAPYVVSDIDLPTVEELVSLYNSVGWSAYTNDPSKLLRAVQASLRVVTARLDGNLVGLVRIVGDGETIVYIQDILVHPSAQRTGFGRQLMASALEPYGDVRQKVLLTDDDPGQVAFYQTLGFTEIRNLPHATNCFVTFG